MTTKLHRILAAVFASSAIALAGAGCGPQQDAKSPSGDIAAMIGKPAPDFTAESVTGEGPTTLKDAKGTVVVLDFWATFCGPCKKSFPKYQSLVEQFGGEVNVLAVSTDDPEDASKEALIEFANSTGAKFAVVWDKNKDAVKHYPTPTMPTSYVIDKEGVIKHVHAGYKDGEEDEIMAEVKALLGK
ncbi:MAG: TlpA family protein disulfide reductase [Polyangiaceae bacterium]|nr:TlpA family protein disulfide reductase [Polyangiaceae bacterium]